MKLLVALLFSNFVFAQSFTVVQINAEWNERNKVDLPLRIEGANVIYGYLSEQPKGLQNNIKAVPVVILYKDNKPISQWGADISFKLKVTREELLEQIRILINRHK